MDPIRTPEIIDTIAAAIVDVTTQEQRDAYRDAEDDSADLCCFRAVSRRTGITVLTLRRYWYQACHYACCQ
jgi:hypothetical protein